MVVLIDTNVVIDYLVDREPYAETAGAIITMCANHDITGYIAAHTVTNIFYILRKVYSISERRLLLKDLCDILDVAGISKSTVMSAIENEDFTDLEDCLQMECAKYVKAKYIVTRNIPDFIHSTVNAIKPDDFLSILKKYGTS